MDYDTDDELVARAVAEAVQRGGPTVVSEPRRIQGMVSDVLGAKARTRRSEIDAVVRAAGELIPERMMSRSIDADGAVTILTATGLDAATADFAVQVWSYALGMLEADAEPPTLTNSIESVESIDDPDPITDDASEESATVDTESVVVDPVAAEGIGPDASGYGTTADGAVTSEEVVKPTDEAPPADITGTKRKTLQVAGIGVVVAVLAIGAAIVFLGKDSEPTKTVSAAKAPTVEFSDVTSPVGTVSRTWTGEGETLVAHLVVVNRSHEAVSGRHYEVLPKSLVESAGDVESEPAHVVIEDDPVIAWDVELDPDEEATFSYTVDVGKPVSAKELETWKKDQITAESAFSQELKAPPALKITSPENQTLAETVFTLTGTTDPTASIEVAGASPEVADDGKWSQPITGLAAGENTLEVVATSRFGVTTSALYKVTVEVPVATTVTTVTTTTAEPASPPTTRPARPPVSPPTTKAPAPPTTKAPTPLKVSISGAKTWYLPGPGLMCEYTLTANINVAWSTIRWSGGSYYNDKTSATFTTNGLEPGSATVTVTVTSRDGQTKTASHAIAIKYSDDGTC